MGRRISAAAVLLVGHVSIQICSLLGALPAVILSSTPLNQARTWCTRGRDQMNALRNGLMEVLPSEAELSPAPVAIFFEGDAGIIIAKAEAVVTKGGRAEHGSSETNAARHTYYYGFFNLLPD